MSCSPQLVVVVWLLVVVRRMESKVIGGASSTSRVQSMDSRIFFSSLCFLLAVMVVGMRKRSFSLL